MNLHKIMMWAFIALVAVLLLSYIVSALNLPPQASETAQDAIVKSKPPDKELLIFVHYKAKPGGGGGGKPSQCPYKTAGKWATKNLSFSVNPNYQLTDESGNPLTSQQIVDVVASGFTPWESSSGLNPPIVTTFSGLPSSYANETMNGLNEISWASLGSKGYTNAIAVTYYWRSRATKEILEADIVNNNDSGFEWFAASPQQGNPNDWQTAGTGKFDLPNIETHEFGHFVGLDHASDAQHTMYAYSSVDEVKKRSLECGDISGVQKLYGS